MNLCFTGFFAAPSWIGFCFCSQKHSNQVSMGITSILMTVNPHFISVTMGVYSASIILNTVQFYLKFNIVINLKVLTAHEALWGP